MPLGCERPHPARGPGVILTDRRELLPRVLYQNLRAGRNRAVFHVCTVFGLLPSYCFTKKKNDFLNTFPFHLLSFQDDGR